MIIERIWPDNAWRNYHYLIACGETGQAMAVDPLDWRAVHGAAQRRGWTITHILNTHEHGDHIGGNDGLRAATGAEVLAHAGAAQTASSWGSRSGLTIERVGVQSPGLSGVFLLERGSLLHFGMNLKFTADNGATWQLSEIRRIRLNEKNYYDNPGLGVIAVVTPVGR